MLEPRVCRAATAWTEVNPEFDYFLFNGESDLIYLSLDRMSLCRTSCILAQYPKIS
jgi:hypothetical protein